MVYIGVSDVTAEARIKGPALPRVIIACRFVSNVVRLAPLLKMPPEQKHKVPFAVHSYRRRVKVSRTRYTNAVDMKGSVTLVEEGETLTGSSITATFPADGFLGEKG